MKHVGTRLLRFILGETGFEKVRDVWIREPLRVIYIVGVSVWTVWRGVVDGIGVVLLLDAVVTVVLAEVARLQVTPWRDPKLPDGRPLG